MARHKTIDEVKKYLQNNPMHEYQIRIPGYATHTGLIASLTQNSAMTKLREMYPKASDIIITKTYKGIVI